MSDENAMPSPAPDDSDIRLASLPDREPIIERMMTEAIDDPQVKIHRARAQFTFFCGFEPQDVSGYDAQLEAVGRCLEWFVFDYFIPELNLTPARYWFNKNKILLSPEELILARNALNFTLGVFEIGQVRFGQSFEAIDLLRNNQRYHIREKIVSQEIEPGQLLLARLFPYRNQYLLSGMATFMAASAARQVKRHIKLDKIIPEYILPNLDGVELENLFNRSLTDIDRLEDLPLLHDRLRQYLIAVDSQNLTFDEVLLMMTATPDPFNVAANICDSCSVVCRHEMDLILAYVMAAWFQTHKP